MPTWTPNDSATGWYGGAYIGPVYVVTVPVGYPATTQWTGPTTDLTNGPGWILELDLYTSDPGDVTAVGWDGSTFGQIATTESDDLAPQTFAFGAPLPAGTYYVVPTQWTPQSGSPAGTWDPPRAWDPATDWGTFKDVANNPVTSPWPSMTPRTTTHALAATGTDDGQGTGMLGAADLPVAAGEDDAGGAGALDLIFPPPVIPPGMTVNPVRYTSYSYDAPTVDTATGVMGKQTRTKLSSGFWGYRQIIVGGRDVTVHRGQRTKITGEMVWSVPGGPERVTLIFPAARPFEALKSSALPWLYDGAKVTIRKRLWPSDALATDWAFEGQIHNPRPVIAGDDWYWAADVKGFLHQSEDMVHKPPFDFYSADAEDIGTRIAQILNYPERTYQHIAPVTIGIDTLQRGSLSENKLAAVRELLGLAWTADGRQWRVIDRPGPGRRSVIELPGTTVDYWISVGQDGVDLSNLQSEGDEAPNVVYGEYVTPAGHRSQNIKYPHEHEDAAPPYPLAPGVVFNAGDGHAGFAPFADWLDAHTGRTIYSGDTYDPRDVDDVEAAQAQMGITVDGVVGAQTWGTAFSTGSNTGDLGGVFYAPLAADPRTQRRLYTPDGQDLGANPAYDPTFPIRETYINFGSGVTRREVVKAARAIVYRNTHGYNLAGTITIRTDHETGSRLDIRHGKIIGIRYLAGSGHSGVPFHIASVSHDDPESDEQPVTLTVDTRYRDAPTLAELIENRREAKDDPARQLRRKETGKLTQSTHPVIDVDNAAGRIYKHTIQGGFWRIVRFPAGAYGTFVQLLADTSPAAELVLGLFVKPVTANFLAAHVGNPLAVGNRTWDTNAKTLRDAGLIQAWGSADQPGGYSSGFAGAKTEGDTLTGRIEDDASTEFASFRPPWLWLAEYSPTSTLVEVTLSIAGTDV